MSRIFDALRQSEKDKLQGSEQWQIPAPGEQPPVPPATEPSIAPWQQAAVEQAAAEEGNPAQGELEGLKETAPAQTLSAAQVPEVPPEARTPQEVIAPILEALRTSAGMRAPVETPDEPHAEVEAPQAVRMEIDLERMERIPIESIQSPLVAALNRERELGAEKFRVLGARLTNIRMGKPLRVLQVTSSVVAEGKTLTSVNLALTLAKRFAQKVLLIEGDMRKPAVCAMLGLANRPGIGEWWADEQSHIGDYLLRIGETTLYILPSGHVPQPTSVLQSARTAELIQQLAQVFDWVVIDTPPLLPMADSNLWSRVSDGTLLVVRKGAVTRAALKKAVECMDNPRLVGVVLNDSNDYDRVNYYSQYSTVAGGSSGAEGKVVSR